MLFVKKAHKLNHLDLNHALSVQENTRFFIQNMDKLQNKTNYASFLPNGFSTSNGITSLEQLLRTKEQPEKEPSLEELKIHDATSVLRLKGIIDSSKIDDKEYFDEVYLDI